MAEEAKGGEEAAGDQESTPGEMEMFHFQSREMEMFNFHAVGGTRLDRFAVGIGIFKSGHF